MLNADHQLEMSIKGNRVLFSSFCGSPAAKNLYGMLYRTILYFAWEDQSEKVCCIVHKVVINCITVLYEPYSTVMCA